MTPVLPFARGTLDTLPTARELVDPLELLRLGPVALEGVVERPVRAVSAFVVSSSGLVGLGGDGGEGAVRRPGVRVRADSDTPFATIPVAGAAGVAGVAGRTSAGDAAVPGPSRDAAEPSVPTAAPPSSLPVDEGGAPLAAVLPGRGAAVGGGAREARLALWRPGTVVALDLASAPGALTMLMGRTADGVVHVGVRLADQVEAPGLTWANLRWCGHLLSDDDSALAVGADALVQWHLQSRFCARCGSRLSVTSGGWTTTCPGCGTIEYPRQDPAVIMAVVDPQDRVLLAHNAAWREGFWSVLAGFVEAGEAPDRAVRREVLEEVGIRVRDVRYVASQPWPFPRSMMMGFLAHVAADEGADPSAPVELHPDGVEIDQARFFTRAELARAISEGLLEPPGPTAIARSLVEVWFGGPLPSSPRRIDPLRRV